MIYLGPAPLLILAAASIAVAQDNVSSADPAGQAALQSDIGGGITPRERVGWIVQGTLGPKNLAAGVFVSGWSTWHNEPDEWGKHWDGFGKRYGMRLSVGGTSNAIEAAMGSVWGEDPRYKRAAGQPLRNRLRHVFVSTFVTHDRNGDPMPAYARFVAVPAGNIVSNMWRPDSQVTASNTSVRIGYGFVSRIVSNAFSEFLPDLTNRLFRKKDRVAPTAPSTPGR
jgi:hypothetical protein